MTLNIQNLRFSYQAHNVLDLSPVTFEQGKIYGIVGRNGVGKTTFFKTLTNIITHYSGSIEIDGQNIKENPKMLTAVGIVLDDMELYKNYSGWFNLRYFGGLRGNFDEERTRILAKELNIYDNLNEKVSRYSLGMNKKLILLISLMSDANILIFDEPFRGLDKRTVEWFKNYLLHLKTEGRMILISSHVQEDIETLADEVLVLENGNFVERFDLRKKNQTYIYRVQTNQPQALRAFLTESHVKFSQQAENWTIFEMNDGKSTKN
ncbi:ABC transporter ATP-binding protein [Lactococcus garvieae]|uniref:ABC transporter ATP-binding protein n=1 Tax=Lactococcus garvieae TaxID=1363 RepID=UPI00254D6076|nr:ABC transporter ATP-binding protein [Lactococcus garvieae]